MFYCEDQTTGQQKSLRTRDGDEARRIVQAKNDAVKLPQMNLVMAKTYLSAQDPKMIIRTWADVLVRFCDRSKATLNSFDMLMTLRFSQKTGKPHEKSCY